GEMCLGAGEALAEALDIAGDASVVLIGEGCAAAHEMLAASGYADVPAQLVEIGGFAAAAWTAALSAVVGEADLILVPASADGRDLAPRLAAALGCGFAAGAISVDTSRALIPRAGGRALMEVPITTPVVVTLQPGVRSAKRLATGDAVEPEIVADLGARSSTPDARVVEVIGADAATMDLAEAPFILGAGIGLGTEASVATLGGVAAALDASIGATRVVTDEGWMPHDRQIGTTGVVVDPTVYVAFGISGAVQHTSGLGAPDHVISVNTDPHCPMMQMADLAIVADAPAVVAELARRLDVADEDPKEVS
ncbi:MAG: mycofactocin-associated electron transfer flavoprotein alpha subunit, partial [Actinobacteria bacterium]|nr:mycofactocin-associated electron transfer flavoprotein alpha subunit [Actinomycetota bacterium]